MKKLLLFFILINLGLNAQTKIEYKNFIKVLDSNKILVKTSWSSGQCNVIDTLGNELLQERFLYKDNIYNEGMLYVSNYNTTPYLYDLELKKKITTGKYKDCSTFRDGIAFIKKKRLIKKTKYNKEYVTDIYAINKEGKLLFKLPKNASDKFADYGYLRDGLIYVRIIHNKYHSNEFSTYNYYDINGKKVIELSKDYVNVSNFSNGLARVQIAGVGIYKYGYIDLKGNLVIKDIFSQKPSVFSDNRAVVETKNHKIGYIDTTGKIVIEPKYYFASGFYKGRAIVKLTQFDKPKLINKKGEILKVFNKVYKFYPEYINSENKTEIIKKIVDDEIIKASLKVGDNPVLIDMNENILNNEKGLIIKSFGYNLLIYNYKGVMGVMNNKMKKLVEFNKDGF